MPLSPELELAETIAAAVHAAIAPLLLRVQKAEGEAAAARATLETYRDRVVTLEAKAAPPIDLTPICERLAVLETRAPVPGPPGPAGADGLGYDDLRAEFDEERTLTITATKGASSRVIGTIVLPYVLYKGIWKNDGTIYTKGDAVTWEGAEWIATEATTAKPGEPGPAARAWRLSVKRGDRHGGPRS